MQLIRHIRGISKLLLILLLLISFIIGALLSYVYTMGFYVLSEINRPSQGGITIENVEFFPENATFFNLTILNPFYYPSAVILEQIMVSTNDGVIHNATGTLPLLPHELGHDSSETFTVFWNWGNYTGQTVQVLAFVAMGSGATFQKETAFMNLTVAEVNFDPHISVTHFNISIQSLNSRTYVDLNKILTNGEDVSTMTTPTVAAYRLDPNDTATFTIARNWTDLQGTNVTVTLQTLQGYTIYKTVSAPPPVILSVVNVTFDENVSLNHFNITILNAESSPTNVDVSDITVDFNGIVTAIQNWTAYSDGLRAPTLEPNVLTIIVCPLEWSTHRDLVVQVTVLTAQGFQATFTLDVP